MKFDNLTSLLYIIIIAYTLVNTMMIITGRAIPVHYLHLPPSASRYLCSSVYIHSTHHVTKYLSLPARYTCWSVCSQGYPFISRGRHQLRSSLYYNSNIGIQSPIPGFRAQASLPGEVLLFPLNDDRSMAAPPRGPATF